MNKKARLNYIHALSSQVERKKMYKAKKQWVVAGISFLVATGMGAIGSHLTTHAAVTNGTNQPQTTSIEKQAGRLADNVKQNAAQHQINSNSASMNKVQSAQPSKVSATPASSKVSGSQSSRVSAKSSTTSNVGTSGSNSFSVRPMMKLGMSRRPLLKAASNQTGTWGKANWTLDSQGNLTVTGGMLGANNNIDWSKVKHLYTQNDTAPANSINLFGAQTGNNTLISADLSGVNFKKCTNLRSLFWHFNQLQSVKFPSDIDTSHVTNMSGMFAGDTQLQSVQGLNHFNTSDVSDMNTMFGGCPKLQSLDLSSFNTHKALANKGYQDNGEYGDGTIDLISSDRNTPNSNDINLRNLKLGPNTVFSADTIHHNQKEAWIYQNGQVTSLLNGHAHPGHAILLQERESQGRIGHANYVLNTNGDLWLLDGSLTNNQLNISNPDNVPIKHIYTQNVTAPADISRLFDHQGNLQTADLSGMNLSKVVTMSWLFNNDHNLKKINFGNQNTPNLQYLDSTFQNDYNLSDIRGLGAFDTSKVTDFWNLFTADRALHSVDLSNWSITPNIWTDGNGDMQNGEADMFNGAAINTITLGDKGDLQIVSDKTPNLQGNWINVDAALPQSVTSSDLEDGNAHSGTWTHNAEIVNLQYKGTTIASNVLHEPENTKKNASDLPLTIPSNYHLDSNNPQVTVNGGSMNLSVHLASSDEKQDIDKAESAAENADNGKVYSLASALVNSDASKVNELISANSGNSSLSANLNQYAGDITNDSNALNAAKNSSQVSNAITAASNADDAYDKAYSANDSFITSEINSDNGKISNLDNIPVYAYLTVLTKGIDGTVAASRTKNSVGVTRNLLREPMNLGVLGQYRKATKGFGTQSALNQVVSNLGNGYHLADPNPDSYKYEPVTVNGTDTVYVLAPQSTKGNDTQPATITIIGDPVNYSGNIILHFSDGNGNNISANGLTSGSTSAIPYSVNTSVGTSNINFLSHATNSAYNVNNPSDYDSSNMNIDGFKVSGFSYENATYQGSSVANNSLTSYSVPSNANSAAGSRTKPNASSYSGNIVLNFKAQSENETINYYYKSGNSNISEGSTIISSGANDTNSYVTANNDNGINSGWSLANSSNEFTFGTGSSSVSVNPIHTSDVVTYMVSDNNSYSKHGQSNGSYTFSGNNWQASSAGDNGLTFSSGAHLSGMPSGYYVVGNQSIKYDGNPVDITIAPSSASFVVTFKDGNSSVGQFTYSGYVDNTVNVSNVTASSGASQSSNSPLPYNYQISSGATSNFSYNANPASNSSTINVIPRAGTPETINYMYGNSSEGTTEPSSNFNATSTVSGSATSASGASGLHAGFQVDSNTQIKFIGGSEIVNVKPQSAGATVDYYTTSNTATPIASASFSGHSYQASVSDDSTIISSGNTPNMPSGYVLNSSSTLIPYDNKTHNVIIKGIDHEPNTQAGKNGESPYDPTTKPIHVKPSDQTHNNSDKPYSNSNNLPKPNDTSYTFYVYVNEYSPKDQKGHSNYIGGYVDRFTETGPTGQTQNINSSDFNPNPNTFSDDSHSNNNPVTIEANGSLSQNVFIFDYTAKAPNTNKPNASQKLTINYVYNSGDTNIPSNTVPVQLVGYTGEKISASDQGILPSNYHINSDQNTTFTIGDKQSATVNVTPENAPINVTFSDASTGKTFNPQEITMSDLANIHQGTLVGDTPNIASLLNIPQGYYLANKDVNVTLKVPFYENKKGFGESLHFNLRSSVPTPTSADINANKKIASDSAAVNSESQSATSMMSNSNLSGVTRDSIMSESNAIASASSAINNDSGKGASAESDANTALASASSAYTSASTIASSVSASVQSSSASASASSLTANLASLVANDVKSNQPTNTGSVNLTSNEEQAIANDIDGNIKSTTSVVTNTVVDSSALNNLTNEVAIENQEISSLANKPANSANINYNYFNDLINSGVSQLTDALNTDFKADLHNAHAKSVKTVGKKVHTYLKWLRVVKPLKLYNAKHEVVKIARPKHRNIIDVKSAYKVNGNIIFKVSYKHHNYFIKAHNKAIKNAYLPATKKLVGRKVRVLYNVYANRHKASGRVKTLHRGYNSKIKNIVKIGNHNVTRIQLSNGLWISANLNYVKVI